VFGGTLNSGPEVFFKTCVAMKLVDDDDDDVKPYSINQSLYAVLKMAFHFFLPRLLQLNVAVHH